MSRCCRACAPLTGRYNLATKTISTSDLSTSTSSTSMSSLSSSSSSSWTRSKHVPSLSSSSSSPLWQPSTNNVVTFPSMHRSLCSTAGTGGSPLNKDNSKNTKKPFQKVLIANRGEIALRVIRTCKQMGIKTVAVYSTADALATFVQEADEAICLGGVATSDSYLNVPKILQAIRSTGADAVHPGYGFLSENSAFVQTIESETGAKFLGPSPYAMTHLGDKIESKILAQNAGVNIIPSFFDGPVESLEHALQLVKDGPKGSSSQQKQKGTSSYPVLLKAASGGGGKGMRICYNDQDLKEAWGIAKAEAKQFFGDDRVLIEKYIENPHHIEFQILAWGAGDGTDTKQETTKVLVFPERECSIQRRNQKVIEESPSVLLKPETRRAMAEQARMMCESVGYRSAGTLEFLVDEEQNFYFLEMNTRLQVEHPVTEAVSSNIDLVKAMLYIGAGWGLPPDDFADLLKDVDLTSTNLMMMPAQGHAMEARIYAEDPRREFLPSTGPLSPYVEPVHTAPPPSTRPDPNIPYIRVDTGVVEGHVVTPHYDPMLAKVISYGPTRQLALDTLATALDSYIIGGDLGTTGGIQHNGRFIRSLLAHPAFVAGDTPTSFLKTHYPKGFDRVTLTPQQEAEFAVAALVVEQKRRDWLQQPPLPGSAGGAVRFSNSHDSTSTSSDPVVVRLGGFFGDAFHVTLSEDKTTATVQKLEENEKTLTSSPVFNISVGKVTYDPARYVMDMTFDGVSRCIQVLRDEPTGEIPMQMYGADYKVLVQSEREYFLAQYMHKPVPPSTANLVMSPMPGTLISFAVKPGDSVQAGQEVCIVEAMKMQNIIRSPRAGVIKELAVNVGESLQTDATLVTLEPVSDEPDAKQAAA